MNSIKFLIGGQLAPIVNRISISVLRYKHDLCIYTICDVCVAAQFLSLTIQPQPSLHDGIALHSRLHGAMGAGFEVHSTLFKCYLSKCNTSINVMKSRAPKKLHITECYMFSVITFPAPSFVCLNCIMLELVKLEKVWGSKQEQGQYNVTCRKVRWPSMTQIRIYGDYLG